jgi:DNA polymerase-3 subunit delta
MATKTTKSKPEGVPHAFEFLERTGHETLPTIVACFGPDEFLRRKAIQKAIEIGQLDESTLRSFDGDETEWRDVHDELATQSLFDLGGHKGARVRNGDKFVTRNRDVLERWIEKGASGSTLFIDVQTLPANTILYKLAKKHGWLVSCAESTDAELQAWVLRWGKSHHRVSLSKTQADILVQRIGSVAGLIDCELAKLALFADDKGAVSDTRVDELVGGWRTQTVWVLADAVADGKIEEAMEAIDKLFMAGQSAFGIAAQISWSLRRYGFAAQQVEQTERLGQRVVFSQILEKAGFRPFEVGKAEARLRRIGRSRAKELLSWLVELELQLKGSHSGEDRARLALEAFLLKLSDLSPGVANNSGVANAGRTITRSVS